MGCITVIDAPSSAGAYGPGQEKAPAALREAGLVEKLEANGWIVRSLSDIGIFRWRPDPKSPRAMNADDAASIAGEVARSVRQALGRGDRILVLGGDCSVGVGTIAGLRGETGSLGLVYADFDADLNTPSTCSDGALDWMGVAHMLGLPGCDRRLAMVGDHVPLLSEKDALLFGTGNITGAERKVIDQSDIQLIGADAVKADPVVAARHACDWADQFDRLAVHFDVDLIDFDDFPLAENTRRKQALPFETAMSALEVVCRTKNFQALTVTEINPDHDPGGNMNIFADRLVEVIGSP